MGHLYHGYVSHNQRLSQWFLYQVAANVEIEN